MKRQILAVVTLVSCFPAKGYSVGSGGFMNQVISARALGRGNTFVAQADDASAAYFNPAGLLQLKSHEASIGLTWLDNQTDFESTNGQKDSLRDPSHLVPNGHLSIGKGESPWRVGLSITSPFGLATEWDQDGPLRYIATKSEIKTFEISPSLAVQVHPSLSVGIGLDYLKVDEVSLARRTNITLLNAAIRAGFGLPPAATYTDGTSSLDGEGEGWGYNLSVHWKDGTTERHRVGVSYRSEINTTVEGRTKLSGLQDESAIVFGGTEYESDAKTALDFPQSFLAGYAFRATERLTFEADYEWVGWSEVKETNISYAESDLTRQSILQIGNPTSRNWKDSSNFGIGCEFAVSQKWAVRGGYWYFEQVIPGNSFSPSLPENARHAATVGTGVSIGSIRADFAYNAIFVERRKINNSVGNEFASSVNGTYETFINLAAVNLSYAF